MTSTTLTYKSALKCLGIIKEVCPNCLTVIGGVHVTFWDSEAFKNAHRLDIVARKEGEITLLELVKKVESENKNFADVLGITYRKDGKVVRNQDRPYIDNLDDIPFPAHHLWAFW